jgi:hypothetical protein
MKHVEHLTEINCVTLHLFGYTWKYICYARTHERQNQRNCLLQATCIYEQDNNTTSTYSKYGEQKSNINNNKLD